MARRTKHPKILTANRLRGGDVVWLGADGRWSPALERPEVGHTPEDWERLAARGAEAETARDVVGAYLMDVEILADGSVRPLSVRERIRALGPSVRTDLGKQATEAGDVPL